MTRKTQSQISTEEVDYYTQAAKRLEEIEQSTNERASQD